MLVVYQVVLRSAVTNNYTYVLDRLSDGQFLKHAFHYSGLSR